MVITGVQIVDLVSLLLGSSIVMRTLCIFLSQSTTGTKLLNQHSVSTMRQSRRKLVLNQDRNRFLTTKALEQDKAVRQWRFNGYGGSLLVND